MAREYKPKVQVMLDYQELEKLLKATEEIPKLRKDLKRMEELYVGLYQLYQEIIERVGDLMRQL